MTDAVVVPFNPKFRKRRKHSGEGIDDQVAMAMDALRPLADAGLFCKPCRGWKKWKEIHISYEVNKRKINMLFWCPCGSLLKEVAK